MRAMEAVKEIMKIKDIRPAVLRDKLGIKKEQHNKLSERFKLKNVSVGKLDEMVRVMDYKILIVPREVKEKKDWFKIE